MSGLFGELSNVSKALSAHRFGVTTAGKNIANVNNPDYARQRVILGNRATMDSALGPVGLGVEALGFAQMRDTVLDREIIRETSLNASLKVQSEALAKAESTTGQLIDRSGDSAFIDGSSAQGSGGIAQTLSEFLNSFHSLSADPSSLAERDAVIHKADILAEQLNLTAGRFVDLQDALSFQVETQVDNANQIIEEIARLNADIASAESGRPGQALILRDQRQAYLEDLSEIMSIQVTTIQDSGGQLRISVPSDTPGETVNLVDYGRFKQFTFDNSVPNSPSFELTGGESVGGILITGGAIHGALQARDGSIQSFIGNLDTLASELVTQVNAIYNSGVAPGNTNFFTDTGAAAEKTAAGISIDATLTSATLRATNDPAQEQGDNTLALALAQLDTTQFAGLGDRSLSEYFRSSVTTLASSAAAVETRMEDETVVLDLLKQQRDSISGVSLDEEMADILKFQRAYESTARVIRTIDEMLDTLINRI